MWPLLNACLTVFADLCFYSCVYVCECGLYRGRSRRRQVPFAVRCCLPKNTKMCLQTSASGRKRIAIKLHICMPSIVFDWLSWKLLCVFHACKSARGLHFSLECVRTCVCVCRCIYVRVGCSSSLLQNFGLICWVRCGWLSYRSLFAACIHFLAYAASVRCFKWLIKKI